MMLSTQNLTLQRRERTILSNISLSIEAGDIIFLQGESGCGKTSLLRLMAFLESPTSGSILFQGTPQTKWVPHLYRKQVSFVFQAPVFLPGTVLENLDAVQKINGKQATVQEFYENALLRLGLSPSLIHNEATHLSQGEKIRLSIVRSLLNTPKMLLLDEPLGALDKKSSIQLLEGLQHYKEQNGVSIVMVSHQQCPIPFANRYLRLENSSLLENSNA